EDVNPRHTTSQYLSPVELRKALEETYTVIIEARNHYDLDLGHYRGAIRPNITRFRDLPDWINENKALFADKKVVTYCTGGIRCEKFSGWLLTEGFEDVAQLHGGIATYGQDPETQGQYWDGKMYEFDDR
ncbi:rhodanese-like domain-containing protein, partial [Staphylococcus aureus]|uniref:rhodanese-like domain-containing protein n=1 Tax=Staphylococcus aureus TaxID=1280 RepID=UPI00210BF0CF